MSIGAACWGGLASSIGIVDALIASAIFMGLSVLAAFLVPLPATDLEEATPPPDTRSRAPPVSLDGRIGPIVVTIEYEVSRERRDAFLALMKELGRVRRRNGATRWSIQQDIDRPEIWIERILSPTWSDHLRRLDRYTVVDRQLVARAEVFRIQNGRSVRRMVERPQNSAPLE
jgi:hypothetical protein